MSQVLFPVFKQFIPVSTECHGYRGDGFTIPEGINRKLRKLLKQAIFPDYS
jgi:hypothetical protein